MIGDPYQLRHITSVGEEAEARFAKRAGVTDLLPRLSYVRNSTYDAAEAALSEAGGHRVFLREHYRCHPEIVAFPARAVYKGRDQLLVRTTPEQYTARIPPPLHGLVWHHVAGQARRVRSSWINDAEIDAIIRLLTEWSAAGHLANTDLSIGIVTPFRPQADAIRDRVRRLDLWASRPPPTVGAAHAFQGDERDVMLLSSVVALGIWPGSASWVSGEVNLLNVAVTRARAGLHVVGDEGACRETGGALRDLVACARLRACDGVANGVGPDTSLAVSTG
ncbi:C-terminal helicase domain-containing protein [Rubrivirga sp. S365]|uniref:C-terminal helicase domain-containing protein n=1 Tax=Rubrivirga litoralis TaxID=3075598 RepID=A0ABU3BU94_9BACT|nr:MULTISPECIES: C-terminal helicase domain-containing protein [unclassified Rubrivirga]MDT0632867.1 C-terminal helicase domain-containing protein [Rubrivirga sp. F394]MDT7855171.1 C-terminal helicase domain-containing protein [Rubrivirga sp. S365]